jgi:hypothetical protein
MNPLVGPGGLSRRHVFRAGSYAAATFLRLKVAPPCPIRAARPKTTICRPVQTLATPPPEGAIGAFGSSRQLPASGLDVVAPALATAAGAITSASASAIRFIVAPSGLRLHRKISRTG